MLLSRWTGVDLGCLTVLRKRSGITRMKTSLFDAKLVLASARLMPLLIACFIQVFSPPVYCETRVYTVGVVPQFDSHTLHAIWRPILDRLEQETGERFKLRGSTSIPDFEEEFETGRFDFAYMNPYHIVVANRLAGYQPLIRDHGRMLQGVLVVRKDSHITSPADLDGKTIAFPAANALGASLQIRQELTDEFGIGFRPRYVKTHDSVYLNVLLNEAAAGGGVQNTLNRQPPEYRDALKVIHRATPVPPHPFCVSPSVPQDVRRKVAAAFLRIGTEAGGKHLLAQIPIAQVGVATLDDYQVLKQMDLDRFFVKR